MKLHLLSFTKFRKFRHFLRYFMIFQKQKNKKYDFENFHLQHVMAEKSLNTINLLFEYRFSFTKFAFENWLIGWETLAFISLQFIVLRESVRNEIY